MASSCPGRGIGGWQWADMPLAMMMMTFKEEIQGVIFDEYELEYQDMSILVAMLRISASQEVNYDVEQSL